MSGRGTITSRTTVSPNSMIGSMSSRSSSSITSSSTATSASASSSSSDTNGPSLQALAGEDHVGQPDRAARADHRSGAEARERRDRRRDAAARPARGARTAHVFGAASASTNTTTTLTTNVAMATPSAPNSRSASDAGERGLHELADQQHEQHRVEEPLGVLDEAAAALGRPGAVLVGQRRRLGRGHARERRLGQREPRETSTRTTTSASDHAEVGPSDLVGESRQLHGSREPAVEARRAARARGPAWPPPRRRRRGPCRARAGCRARRAARARRRSVPAWSGALRAATPGRSRRRRAAAARRRASARSRRARSAVVGPAARADQVVVDREREHVGRAVVAHEPLVELGDRRLVDEQQRQLGVAAHALGVEHRARRAAASARRRPACVGLLVGDEHLDAALVGQPPALATVSG